MPKAKTHSGAKKRFGLTSTGKVKFKHAKLRHILTKKSKHLKRGLRKPATLAECDAKLIRRLIDP